MEKTSFDYLADCINKHGDKYDYSKSVFRRSQDKVTITCNVHGDFDQRLGSHLAGKGCPYCSGNKTTRLGKFIDHSNGTASIPLTQGKYALVDIQHAEKISKYNWYYKKAHNTGYAACNKTVDGRQETIFLHRLIMSETKKEIFIDHVNGNGLDNRVVNLRRCTNTENLRNRAMQCNNTVGYKGVTKLKSGKFRAQICIEGSMYYLGNYDTPELAGKAYDEAAKECFGEFARLNFLSA